MSTVRVQFDGKVLVPLDRLELVAGQVLDADLRPVTDPPAGSPQAILRVLDSLPAIPTEYVDELERAIEEAKLPVRHEGVFDGDD